MRILFQIVLIIIPISTYFEWIEFDRVAFSMLDSLRYDHPDLPKISTLPMSTRLECYIIAMIPNFVVMFGLYHLIKLLKLYEIGLIFTKENINQIKICSYTIFVWFFANFLASTLLVLALTMNNPEGQRILSITFASKEFSALVIGTIAIFIAHIMEEARKIKDENDHTV